jgi:sugar phosphate isomerase/epimerase
MIPVTTRLDSVVRDGLVATVRSLLGRGVPGIVLEAPGRDAALAPDTEALGALRAPIVGAIAPLDVAPSSLETVAASDDGDAREAAQAVRAAAAAVAPLGCRNVVAVVGAAGIGGEESLRELAGGPGSDTPAKIDAWRIAARPVRERRAAAICRLLHGVARGIAPQRLLLLPDADPAGFLDPESAGWILDDLRQLGVGLALDSGWTWAAESRGGAPLLQWLARHAPRLGFLLVSDHDGLGCGEVLPGAGRGDLAVLRDAIGKRTPRAIRPDPRASRADLLAAVDLAARHLGAAGDVVGW